MKAERIEAVWVEEQHLLSIEDLDRRWGLSVTQIHDRYEHAEDVSFDALDALIKDIEAARKSGTPAPQIEAAQLYQRKASYYMDYVVSENSRGFHAPGYTLRLLNDVTDASRKGQLALRDAAAAAKAKDEKLGPIPAASATTSPTPQADSSVIPAPTPTASK